MSGIRPSYQFGLPFDNVKIIFNSLVGDPRYHFKPTMGRVVAHNEYDAEVFDVVPSEAPILDHEYAESIISKESLLNVNEFGKLFYSYGSAALSEIAASIVRINDEGNPIFKSPEMITCNKLGIAFNRFFDQYMAAIGIKEFVSGSYAKSTDEKNHLQISRLVDDVSYMYEKSIKCEKPYFEFGEVLSLTYLSLTAYLTGVFINLSEKFGISLEALYSDGNTHTIDVFGDRIISSEILNGENKYKLISLLYTYYLVTKFFESHLGISFTDKFIAPFVLIGEKISKMDLTEIESELDISYLTQSGLERKSTKTMLSILSEVSVIKQPTVFDSYLVDHDCADMCTQAAYLVKYLECPEVGDAKLECYLDDSGVSATDIDVLYNHFIDDIAYALPHTISPKYFFMITVYAAAFRKLKNSKSGAAKEQAALGLYQAEAIMVQLYKEWFISGYAYNLGTGIYCPDIRKVAKDIKAEAYVKYSIYNYNEYVYKTEINSKENDDEPYWILNTIENSYPVEAVNSNESDLSAAKDSIRNFNTYPINYAGSLKTITEMNYEEYDENVKLLNECKISFIQFFLSAMENSESYNHKYINYVLETDYQQKAMDELVNMKSDEMNYNMIHNSKLAKVLSNNISDIFKCEKTEDRFDIYFNVFIKCLIARYLCALVFDNTSVNEEDKLGQTRKEEENILPNIRSNRLFNFLDK